MVDLEQAEFCLMDAARSSYTCRVCGTVCCNVKDWTSHARSRKHKARRAVQVLVPWALSVHGTLSTPLRHP